VAGRNPRHFLMKGKNQMEETKQKRTRKPILSEKDQEVFESIKDTMSEERKDEWLKRRAREDRALKLNQKEVSRSYVKVGEKLILKVKKANGGVYSLYQGNWKKFPQLLTPEVKELLEK